MGHHVSRRASQRTVRGEPPRGQGWAVHDLWHRNLIIIDRNGSRQGDIARIGDKVGIIECVPDRSECGIECRLHDGKCGHLICGYGRTICRRGECSAGRCAHRGRIIGHKACVQIVLIHRVGRCTDGEGGGRERCDWAGYAGDFIIRYAERCNLDITHIFNAEFIVERIAHCGEGCIHCGLSES